MNPVPSFVLLLAVVVVVCVVVIIRKYTGEPNNLQQVLKALTKVEAQIRHARLGTDLAEFAKLGDYEARRAQLLALHKKLGSQTS